MAPDERVSGHCPHPLSSRGFYAILRHLFRVTGRAHCKHESSLLELEKSRKGTTNRTLSERVHAMQALSQLSYGPARLYLDGAGRYRIPLLRSGFLPHLFPVGCRAMRDDSAETIGSSLRVMSAVSRASLVVGIDIGRQCRRQEPLQGSAGDEDPAANADRRDLAAPDGFVHARSTDPEGCRRLLDGEGQAITARCHCSRTRSAGGSGAARTCRLANGIRQGRDVGRPIGGIGNVGQLGRVGWRARWVRYHSRTLGLVARGSEEHREFGGPTVPAPRLTTVATSSGRSGSGSPTSRRLVLDVPGQRGSDGAEPLVVAGMGGGPLTYLQIDVYLLTL